MWCVVCKWSPTYYILPESCVCMHTIGGGGREEHPEKKLGLIRASLCACRGNVLTVSHVGIYCDAASGECISRRKPISTKKLVKIPAGMCTSVQ